MRGGVSLSIMQLVLHLPSCGEYVKRKKCFCRFSYSGQLLYHHWLQYFVQGYNKILSYTTLSFLHFSYKVLGVLPRLIKGPNAISYAENINILLPICLQRCITVLPLLRFSLSALEERITVIFCTDNSYLNSPPFYLYSRQHHIRTTYLRLTRARYHLMRGDFSFLPPIYTYITIACSGLHHSSRGRGSQTTLA